MGRWTTGYVHIAQCSSNFRSICQRIILWMDGKWIWQSNTLAKQREEIESTAAWQWIVPHSGSGMWRMLSLILLMESLLRAQWEMTAKRCEQTKSHFSRRCCGIICMHSPWTAMMSSNTFICPLNYRKPDPKGLIMCLKCTTDFKDLCHRMSGCKKVKNGYKNSFSKVFSSLEKSWEVVFNVMWWGCCVPTWNWQTKGLGPGK